MTDLLGLIVVHTVGGLYLLSVSACVCGQIMRVKEKWCSPYFITSASMPRVVLCLPTLTAYQRCPNQIMAFHYPVFLHSFSNPQLMKIIVECPEDRLEPEVIALGLYNYAAEQK